MLKRLRLKFIALNMAIAACVLAVAFASICFANYQQALQSVRTELDMALDRAVAAETESAPPSDSSHGSDSSASSRAGESGNDQATADLDASEPDKAPARTDGPDSPSTANDAGAVGSPPQIGGERGGSDPSVPIALYALAEDGTPIALAEATTASLSDDVLAKATESLSSVGEGDGTIYALGLHYQKRIANGTVYLAFADMSATSSWRSLIPLLAVVGAAALVALLAISVLFSRWALKPVARTWEQQKRFVGDASHDLKTPLTVILANTSILMQHPNHTIESERQWLESTRHEAEDMQHLVENLLIMAQVDEKAHAPFESVDLAEAVEAETLQFESIAFDRGLSLECTVESGLRVSGDAALLRRMVSALLENACKYADPGGTVEVSLSKTGREARLTVRNDGPAIPAEDLPHVFERFYRADKARAGGAGGFGLGLSIAHAIVADHGGTLTAASDDDHGTAFTATLPLA